MKRINIFLLLGGLILSLYCTGCRNNLLPDPIGEEINPSSEENNQPLSLTVPQNVNATKGGKQKIVLSWTPVLKASKYYIYAASTQFDNFQKIGESTETEYTYLVNAGLTRYFQITAVNYLGEESEPSLIAMGATLACPYISSIVSNETENGVVTEISWYMDNVNYYLDGLNYTISVFNKGAIATSVTIVGSAEENGKLVPVTSYTFTDLPENSDLEFQVEAFLVSEQNDIESSDQTNAATAARQTPNAVTELEATQGTDKTSITLSFKTPDFVFIKTKDSSSLSGAYEAKPTYFKIFRRTLSSEWVEQESHLYYDGTVAKPENSEEFFDKYASGKEVTWVDKNVPARGVKYEYKVQTYVDDLANNEIISSDKAIATNIGWCMAVPDFKWKDFDYEYEEITDAESGDITKEKTGASLNYNVIWNNFGVTAGYKFIVETKWTELTLENNPKEDIKYTVYSSINDLNKEHILFNPKTSDSIGGEGYYTFTFYILPADADNSIEHAIDSVVCSARVFVTSNMKNPEFKDMKVISGYNKKVLIQWTEEDSTYIYIFERYKLDDSNNKIIDSKKVITLKNEDGSIKTDGTICSYEDKDLEDGVTYKYDLKIQNQTEEFPYDDSKGELKATTLGIPAIIFDADNLFLNKIPVSWKKVPEAKSYKLVFNGVELSEEITDEDADVNGLINFTLEGETHLQDYYKDASKSGKDATLEVIVSSQKEDESTLDTNSAAIQVRTLGPAETKLSASVAQYEKKIALKWDEVPGAKKYVIERQICNLDLSIPETEPDYFVVNSNTLTYNDEYKACTDETADSTDKNQDLLDWGLPFKYTVYPISVDSEKDTVAKLYTTGIDKISKYGSTIGYGHNIKASKSEDPRNVIIEWDSQYLGTADSDTQNLSPTLLYRQAGTTAYKKAIGAKKTGNKYTYKLSGNERTSAFDFVITYSQSQDNYTISASYENELAKAIDERTQSYWNTDAKPEPLNRGYAFAINLTFEQSSENSGIQEDFKWNLWDYSKRTLGPDETSKYSFEMKNNDFAAEWQKVAEIDLNGTITQVSSADLNITCKRNGTGLNDGYSIKPTAESTYGYSGILKVLRDYRHFARLEVTRSDCESPASYSDGNDESVFGYREITDVEWIRLAMLSYAEGFWTACKGDKTWDSASKNTTSYENNQGSIKILKDWGTIKYTYTDWAPIVNGPVINGFRSIVSLNTDKDTASLKSASINESKFTTSINSANIYISPTIIQNASTGPIIAPLELPETFAEKLYGTINISSSGKDNLSLSYKRENKNGELLSEGTISCGKQNEPNRRYFLPIRYDGEDNWWHNNANGTTYGWW